MVGRVAALESELSATKEIAADAKAKLSFAEMRVRELENDLHKKPPHRGELNYRELVQLLVSNESLANTVLGKGLVKVMDHYESLLRTQAVHRVDLEEGLSERDFTVSVSAGVCVHDGVSVRRSAGSVGNNVSVGVASSSRGG